MEVSNQASLTVQVPKHFGKQNKVQESYLSTYTPAIKLPVQTLKESQLQQKYLVTKNEMTCSSVIGAHFKQVTSTWLPSIIEELKYKQQQTQWPQKNNDQ